MELFDKKFVHFMWDDELKGKRGFLSSGIDALIKMVNEDSDRTEIQKGCERDLPFCKHITVECRLAYYDPNYEVKKAFNKGKRLQFRPKNEHLSWGDCVNPSWDVKLEYRVKPECHCEDGIDSKACVGCEHSEDGKPHPFENYHCYVCDKSDKKYRPYESSAEMIVDFIDRFKVKCPSYCEPLIWVKHKQLDYRYLVSAFHKNCVKIDGTPFGFEQLLNDYTYLDGSPVGMEAKE